MKKLGFIALITIFSLSTAMAQLVKVDQEVFGMDCAPCAYGLERGLKKMNGLEKIRVSLNDGKAYLSLQTGNKLTLKKIQDEVKKNGFSARAADVVVVGELSRSGNEWIVRVNGESFQIASNTEQELLNSLKDGTMKLRGIVADEDDKHLSDRWTIRIIEILSL